MVLVLAKYAIESPITANMLWLLLAGLCVAGILDTLYVLRFTFAPVAQADPEAACRLDDPGHCQTLFQSKTARLVGNIPNSALGFVFYGVVGLSAIAALIGLNIAWWWLIGMLLAALAAVAMSLYLFNHLLFVRKTTCIPCFIGQGINVLMLVMLGELALRHFFVRTLFA